MRLKCWMNDANREGIWRREVTFPCFPFPGLFVGSHKVKRVFVCQGDLDGGGDVEVQFKREETDVAILEHQGWKWESVD